MAIQPGCTPYHTNQSVQYIIIIIISVIMSSFSVLILLTCDIIDLAPHRHPAALGGVVLGHILPGENSLLRLAGFGALGPLAVPQSIPGLCCGGINSSSSSSSSSSSLQSHKQQHQFSQSSLAGLMKQRNPTSYDRGVGRRIAATHLLLETHFGEAWLGLSLQESNEAVMNHQSIL